MASKSSRLIPNVRSWVSSSVWHERIITFDPSWFTLTMGTGVIVQLLNYFPWGAGWLQRLGYVYWILTIVLFSFFVAMGCLRIAMHPKVALSILDDFSQTSYLGGIPISLNTITAGLELYYGDRVSAVYVAEAFYWTSVAMTAAVGLGGVFAMYRHQGQHQLDEVTGVWLLSFIPMVVTAALGSAISQRLSGNNAATVLFVSFIMLSLGLGLSFIIITIYFWRLMACNLPARDAIVSCFVPVGPLSMGAFAVLGLSVDTARFITVHRFTFQESWSLPVNEDVISAIGQMIIWLGVIFALMLLGVASFFLVEAFASVLSKVPKSFNIGFWSFVFPCGVYANAFCRLSTTLRNDGIKYWAAICVVGTILLWLMCALVTTYKGVWQGKTFLAPGLQGFVEQQELEQLCKNHLTSSSGTRSNGHTTARELQRQHPERELSPDGTYQRVSPSRNEDADKAADHSV